MHRICQECNKENKGPYKSFCRSCYQNKWVKTIQQKECLKCQIKFASSGKICRLCLDKARRENSRKISCKGCGRIGLLIENKTDMLCTKCDRNKKERIDPSKAEQRRLNTMKYNRAVRGTDINAPKRVSKGWWKSADGYIQIYKKDHPNAKSGGCIPQHVFVMSEHIQRPLTKDETVHHINGVRDDNRIENLELWSKSHPPGQRVCDKIKWAKEILEKYKEY